MLSLPIFISMAVLPLRTKQQSFTQNPKRKIPWNLAAEVVLLAIILEIVLHHRNQIHPNLVLICYCFMFCFMIDILVALSSSIVKIFVGLELQLQLELELEPPSNEPYFSTSLQDFWGRRWNLTVTNTLRYTVYNPMRSLLSGAVSKEWAQGIATLVAFVVSGLMHELIFYYITRANPSWEMTWFFVLHGLCVAVETLVKRAVKDTWRLPGLVSGPLTIGFLMATAFGFFFPPLIRNGADERLLEEVGYCFDLLKHKMLQLLGHFT